MIQPAGDATIFAKGGNIFTSSSLLAMTRLVGFNYTSDPATHQPVHIPIIPKDNATGRYVVDLREYPFTVVLLYLRVITYLSQFGNPESIDFFVSDTRHLKLPLNEGERVAFVRFCLQIEDLNVTWPVIHNPQSATEAAGLVVAIMENEGMFSEPSVEIGDLLEYISNHSGTVYPQMTIEQWERLWDQYAVDDSTPEEIAKLMADPDETRKQVAFATIFLRTGYPADSFFGPKYTFIISNAAELMIPRIQSKEIREGVMAQLWGLGYTIQRMQ